MSTPRPTTTDRLNEHESRLDGQDKTLTIIQEQFTAFQALTHEQLETINKVVDSLKDTKVDLVRLQEKSIFDEWKRAILVGFVMLFSGSALGVTVTLLLQFLQHIHL